MAKKPPLDLDEENAERAKYAGMTRDEIDAAASAIRTQKRKSAEIAGDLSGKLEVFTQKGGHKSALKQAEKIADLEPAECADWMRSFLAYFEALGGNDQLDMFDQQSEQEKNADSVVAASKPVKEEKSATEQITALHAEPKTGAEPTVTVN